MADDQMKPPPPAVGTPEHDALMRAWEAERRREAAAAGEPWVE